MARWALVEFSETSFTWGTKPLVEFPEVERQESLVFCASWKKRGTRRAVSFVSDDGGWCLASERIVNRVRCSPFTRLQHGDVIEVDGRVVMLRGVEPTWPALPELEQLAMRSGGAPAELSVLGDAVLERIGGDGLLRLAGVLRPMLERGLMLELSAGFPTRVEFRVSAPRVGGWLRRWSHALTTLPLFQFVRRVDLRVPDAAQHEVDWQVRALAMGLASNRLPLLQEVHLDLPLNCTDCDSLEQLRRTTQCHLAVREQRDEPADTGMHDDVDVRFFEPPVPSSWFH